MHHNLHHFLHDNIWKLVSQVALGNRGILDQSSIYNISNDKFIELRHKFIINFFIKYSNEY